MWLGLDWPQDNFSIPYFQRMSLKKKKKKILDSSPNTKNRFEIQIFLKCLFIYWPALDASYSMWHLHRGSWASLVAVCAGLAAPCTWGILIP